MNRLIRLFACCCLFLVDMACFGQGTSISIINNSQSWLLIYRIGNPSYTVEVQKRWNQMITLPLAPGGGEDAQMIEIGLEGTSTVTPETSFQGFDGSFAQNCTITVNDSSISISYAGSGGSSTNSDDSNASNTNSLANGSGGGGGGGVGGGGGGPGGIGKYRGASTGTNSNSQAAPAFDYATKPAPPKRYVLAGATGVRVRVARPDAKIPALEAPSAGQTKTNKLDAIPSVTSLPPEPPKRSQNGYYLAVGAILLVIALFVASKVHENHKPRNPYRRPNR